jgi:glycosyltransferase involved in cell wall biosynthesis
MTHLVILHSSAEFYGSDRSLLSLVRAACASGHTVTIVVPDDGPLVAKLREAGGRVRKLPVAVLRRALLTPKGFVVFFRHVLATLRYYGWLRDLHGTEQVRLISNTSIVVSGYLLARRWKIPHTVIVREFFKPGIELKIFQNLIDTSTEVISVSRAVADQFSGDLAATSHVVYSGADLKHSSWSATPEHQAHTELRILCPGRLNAWKGQDVLIEALSLLGETKRPVVTRVVGGEYLGTTIFAQALHEKITHLRVENIELVGELPSLESEYAWSDIVIVPSKRAEPFGKVVIEAMNQGRPVISTNVGGPAEVITSGLNGVLVAPGSAQELAKAISSFVNDSKLIRVMAKAAFERSLDFDANHSAQQIVDIVVPR